MAKANKRTKAQSLARIAYGKLLPEQARYLARALHAYSDKELMITTDLIGVQIYAITVAQVGSKYTATITL